MPPPIPMDETIIDIKNSAGNANQSSFISFLFDFVKSFQNWKTGYLSIPAHGYRIEIPRPSTMMQIRSAENILSWSVAGYI
jgi:hypothetical protein